MRRSISLRVLGVVAVALLLAPALASAQGQPPGQGQGRGRGLGMGGPGGGAPLLMLQSEPIQKELALTPEQVTKLKTLSEEALQEMRSVAGPNNFQELQNLPEEERRTKMRELRTKMAEASTKVNEKYQPKVAEVLQPAQAERLQQISWQAAGKAAIADPKLAKTLGLSEEQQKQAAAAMKEHADKQQELFAAGGGGDFQERFAKMRELNDARDKQLDSILNDEQKKKFDELKGKPFDLQQLRGPGGNRPRTRPATN